MELDWVMEDWRICMDVEFNMVENWFESNEESFVSIWENYYFRGSIVKSFGNYWFVGIFLGLMYNIYWNIDFFIYV